MLGVKPIDFRSNSHSRQMANNLSGGIPTAQPAKGLVCSGETLTLSDLLVLMQERAYG